MGKGISMANHLMMRAIFSCGLPLTLAANSSSFPTYASDIDSGQVYSIDTTTNIANGLVSNPFIMPPTQPFSEASSVALSPTGTFGYIVNTSLPTEIYRFDTATNTATGTVANSTATPFTSPIFAAIGPSGNFAYLIDSTMAPGLSIVYYIDASINAATTLVSNISGFTFPGPGDLAISPDGVYAYIASNFSGPLSYIDVASNTVTKTVPGITSPFGVAISPDAKFAYVSGGATTHDVWKVDVAANSSQVTSNGLTSFIEPKGIAISPDGNTAYVVDTNRQILYYIDTSTNAVTQEVSLPLLQLNTGNSVVVTQDGKTLYIGGRDVLAGNGVILYVDLESGTPTPTALGNATGVPFLNITSITTLPPVFVSPVTRISVLGLSGNNLSLANYLNENAPASTLRLFTTLQGDELKNALESAAPTRNAFFTYASQTAQISLGRVLTDHLRRDLEAREQTVGEPVAARFNSKELLVQSEELEGQSEKQPLPISSQKSKPSSFWIGGFGQYAHEKPQSQTPSFNAGSAGAVIAWDTARISSYVLGAGAAYAHTHLDEDENAGYVNIDQGDLFIYGTIPVSGWYFDIAIWGGYYRAKNIRKISFPGYSNKATLKTHGWQTTPHFEVGYDYRSDWFRLEPFTFCDWVNCWERGARESGANLLNMGQEGRYCSLLRSETGVRFYETFEWGWGTLTLTEKGSYAYQKAFHTGNITAFLIGSPGSFTVTTLTGAQNLGVGEFEMFFHSKSKGSPYVSLSYNIEMGSRYQSHQGTATLGKDF